jgi:hypothetical protein
MLTVDARKRPTTDQYLSLHRTIADDMLRVDEKKRIVCEQRIVVECMRYN